MGFDIIRYGSGEYARIRRKASVRLAEIEARKGKTPKVLLTRADEYAKEVFGDEGFAPWLYVYTAMAGEFRQGWIPNDYYQLVVLPRINGAYGQLAKLKSLYMRLFSPESSLDVGSFVNGYLFSSDGKRISFDIAREALFAESERIIFKPDQSNRGRGIKVFVPHDFTLEKVAELGNGTFQAFVRQHPALAAFCPTAVATARLTTVIDAGGVPRLRSCHIRLGREMDEWITSARQVNVPVCPTSGEFSDVGYLPDWSPTAAHPDTGVPFSGFAVPSFIEAVAHVVDLHSRFRFVRIIGWDVAIDETGRARVMEWNGDQPGIAFAQAMQGPCFSDLGWEEFWRADGPRMD